MMWEIWFKIRYNVSPILNWQWWKTNKIQYPVRVGHGNHNPGDHGWEPIKV